MFKVKSWKPRHWLWALASLVCALTAPRTGDRWDYFLYMAFQVGICGVIAWLVMRWSVRTRGHILTATAVLVIVLGINNVYLRAAEVQAPAPGERYTLAERQAADRLLRHSKRVHAAAVYCLAEDSAFRADANHVSTVMRGFLQRNGVTVTEVHALLDSSGAVTRERARRFDREVTSRTKSTLGPQNRTRRCRALFRLMESQRLDLGADSLRAADVALVRRAVRGTGPTE